MMIRFGIGRCHPLKGNREVQFIVDMVRRLELVLGVPSQFCCNLETMYRETLTKVAEENSMDTDIALLKNEIWMV